MTIEYNIHNRQEHAVKFCNERCKVVPFLDYSFWSSLDISDQVPDLGTHFKDHPDIRM